MKLRNLIKRLRRDERGGASVEFVIAVPLIMFWFAGSYTIYDAYASSTRALKATYAVADILSRQVTVDEDYIDDMNMLFSNIMGQTTDQTMVRVTSVRKVEDGYELDWSDASGSGAPLLLQDLPEDLIPIMIEEETVILVEAYTPFSPLWSYAGVNARTYSNKIAVSPRFSPMLSMEYSA